MGDIVSKLTQFMAPLCLMWALLAVTIYLGVPVKKAYDSADFSTALDEAFKATGPVIVEAMLGSREYDNLVLRKDKPSI